MLREKLISRGYVGPGAKRGTHAETWLHSGAVPGATALAPRCATAETGALRWMADDDAMVRDMSEAAFRRTGTLAWRPAEWIDRLIGHYEMRLREVQSEAEAQPWPGIASDASSSEASPRIAAS